MPYLDGTQAQTAPSTTSFTQDPLIPGFNLDESGMPRRETRWFDGMVASPTGVEEPVGTTLPQLPEWLINLLTMPLPRLSTAFDPRTGRRIVAYSPLIRPLSAYQTTDESVRPTAGRPVDNDDASSLPSPGSIETPDDEEWPASDMPEWRPAVTNPRSSIAVTQNSNLPSTEEAAWNAWLQPLKEAQPSISVGSTQRHGPSGARMVQPPMSVPPTLSIRPGGNSNFVLVKAGDAGMPPAPQDQKTQPRNQATPPTIITGYARGPGSNDAITRMELPANTRTASVPNIRGSVVASLDHGGMFDGTPYQAHGVSSGLGTPFGYTGRRGSTYARNNPLNLVDLHRQRIEGSESTRPSMSDAYPEPLIPGAQYAQVVVQRNQAVTGNPRIDRTTERLLSILADTVQSLGPGAGPIFGIQVHFEFGRRVKELNIPGIRQTGVEHSFSLGGAARYGMSGSVRTDIVLRDRDGIPISVYDLKTGNAKLTPSRVREIREALRQPDIPVIELRYRDESAILR